MVPTFRVTLVVSLTVMLASTAAAQIERADARPRTPAAVRSLASHVPITGELQGEKRHRYTVALEAGDSVRINVAQRGIDVAVSLVAPSAREVLAVNASDDPFRSETLSAIAATAPAR